MTTLLEHWESITEASNEDAAQLKRDMKNHPRSSGRSLRELAKVCATQGSFHVQRRLDDMYAWLAEHRDQLPREIEDEHGNRGSDQRLEKTGTDYDDKIVDVEEFTPENGLYDCGGKTCYGELSNFADPAKYKERGMEPDVYVEAMQKRGASFQRYMEAKSKRLRWRGMTATMGVTRALDLIGKGVTMKPAKSNAKPLPSLERLNELLSYDPETGVLAWAVSRGRVQAGTVALTVDRGRAKTRVDGTLWISGRIAYKLHTGEDPGDAVIDYVDGDATNLRWDNLRISHMASKSSTTATERVRKLSDSRWESMCRINGKLYSVGTFDNEQTAEQAYALFVRTFERFGASSP